MKISVGTKLFKSLPKQLLRIWQSSPKKVIIPVIFASAVIVVAIPSYMMASHRGIKLSAGPMSVIHRALSGVSGSKSPSSTTKPADSNQASSGAHSSASGAPLASSAPYKSAPSGQVASQTAYALSVYPSSITVTAANLFSANETSVTVASTNQTPINRPVASSGPSAVGVVMDQYAAYYSGPPATPVTMSPSWHGVAGRYSPNGSGTTRFELTAQDSAGHTYTGYLTVNYSSLPSVSITNIQPSISVINGTSLITVNFTLDPGPAFGTQTVSYSLGESFPDMFASGVCSSQSKLSGTATQSGTPVTYSLYCYVTNSSQLSQLRTTAFISAGVLNYTDDTENFTVPTN
jgi:hypothetical protein